MDADLKSGVFEWLVSMRGSKRGLLGFGRVMHSTD